jgi:hypothetical protein
MTNELEKTEETRALSARVSHLPPRNSSDITWDSIPGPEVRSQGLGAARERFYALFFFFLSMMYDIEKFQIKFACLHEIYFMSCDKY